MELDAPLRLAPLPYPAVASFVWAWLAVLVTALALTCTPLFFGTFAADFHRDGWSYIAMLPVGYLYFFGAFVLFLGVPAGVLLGALIALKTRAIAFYALAGAAMAPLLMMAFSNGVPWEQPSTWWLIVCGAASGIAAWYTLWRREPDFMRRGTA